MFRNIARLFRRRSSWLEPSTHDLGILAGGQVIHYSTCWCKPPRPAGNPTTPSAGGTNA